MSITFFFMDEMHWVLNLMSSNNNNNNNNNNKKQPQSGAAILISGRLQSDWAPGAFRSNRADIDSKSALFLLWATQARLKRSKTPLNHVKPRKPSVNLGRT